MQHTMTCPRLTVNRFPFSDTVQVLLIKLEHRGKVHPLQQFNLKCQTNTPCRLSTCKARYSMPPPVIILKLTMYSLRKPQIQNPRKSEHYTKSTKKRFQIILQFSETLNLGPSEAVHHQPQNHNKQRHGTSYSACTESTQRTSLTFQVELLK